ncbi:MAG: YdcF family protein [Deltaproteobacteria bacterium]|nr:YdcF family protein [Deltaproteobacteria bacterium]
MNILVIWMLLELPYGIDRWLVHVQKPEAGDFIVCATAGLTDMNLPTQDGWERVISTVGLYLDGYAPKVVFSGGGVKAVSEAAVYAETARWLGCPDEAILLDQESARTLDHPRNIVKIPGAGLSKMSSLNVVTSAYHSRRVGLCFTKSGFANFRVVADYKGQNMLPLFVRLSEARVSTASEQAEGLVSCYHRLKHGSSYVLDIVKELCALGWYWIQGYL